MIDHVSISVRALERSAAFYEAILAEVGIKKLVSRSRTIGFGKKYPEFWLNERPNVASEQLSDGFHVCLRAASIEHVQAFFRYVAGRIKPVVERYEDVSLSVG
jgi:catechol 2,3-dioxygenase-like lactoylglutathione lyase family enzyme